MQYVDLRDLLRLHRSGGVSALKQTHRTGKLMGKLCR